MKRNIITIMVLTILFSVLTNIFAQPRKQFKMKKDHMIEQLNLTKDQQEKFDQLHYSNQEKAIDLRAEIQKNRLEIKKLMGADQINETELMELTKSNNSIRNEIQESRLRMWLDIYNLLNDTQKEVWKECRKGFGKESMQHGNRGRRNSYGMRVGDVRDNMPGRRGMNPDFRRN